MTRSSLSPVLAEASAPGRAVAAFNVIQIEHAGSLAPLAPATLAIADACSQPVVVHLDHAEDVALGAARDAVTDEAARLMHLLAHP